MFVRGLKLLGWMNLLWTPENLFVPNIPIGFTFLYSHRHTCSHTHFNNLIACLSSTALSVKLIKKMKLHQVALKGVSISQYSIYGLIFTHLKGEKVNLFYLH